MTENNEGPYGDIIKMKQNVDKQLNGSWAIAPWHIVPWHIVLKTT